MPHLSEGQSHSEIDLSACKIIRNGILLIAHIGNPIIRIDVGNAEKIKAVDTEPHRTQRCLPATVLTIIEQIAHTNVGTLICRRTEIAGTKFLVWHIERKAIGERQFQVHLPTLRTGEVVSEIQIDGITLVGRERQ